MMMLWVQNLSRGRIVEGQQRQRAQIAEEVSQPQAANGDGHNHICRGEIKGLREIWLDDPEQVYKTHQHEPHSQPDKFANITLQRARQQNRERNREVEDGKDESDPSPAAVEALHIKRDLGGQVSSPDDEPLREAEVGPDHGESQHPLAVIVDEVRLQHLGHGLVVVENALDHDREAHGGEHFTDENDQAEDGRDPTGIERHDPIDGRERNGESVEDEARTGDGFESFGVVGGAGAVGLLRPVREQERKHVSDGEVDDGADDEASAVEISALDEAVLRQMLADVRILNRLQGHEPRIDAMLQDRNHHGDEKNRQQRKRAHGRAENAADDHAPAAAREVADHEDG